jgi:hypothetical protein
MSGYALSLSLILAEVFLAENDKLKHIGHSIRGSSTLHEQQQKPEDNPGS